MKNLAFVKFIIINSIFGRVLSGQNSDSAFFSCLRLN